MKRRIPFKTITLILGILIIVYNLYSNSNYIFTLLRVFIIISLVPWLILLARNIKFSGWLFKKRFYWFYPTTFFIVFALSGLMNSINKPDFISLNLILIVLGVSTTMGLIWGIIEKFRTKKYADAQIAENLDLLDDEADNDQNGVLMLKQDELIFKVKNQVIFQFKKSEIDDLKVVVENKIFPVCLEIKNTNGLTYQLNSQFPYVWLNAIQTS